MVHAVEAPQGRQPVEQPVLEVDDEVEGCHCQDDSEPGGEGQLIQEPPAVLLGGDRHADGEYRQQQAGGSRVDGHQGQIGKPAPPPAVAEPATGRQ